jgi:hypothetical protein
LTVALALVLLLASSSMALSPGSGGATFLEPPVRAVDGAFAGKKTTITGHSDAGSGEVAISAKLGSADWLPVGTADADASGDFNFAWKPARSGLYTFRIAPVGAAVTAAAEVQGTVSVYRTQKATWYGPESYGSRTACGVKLTKRTLGVAHKTLPCGTKVEFFLPATGKKITIPVIDRGPYANGAIWDLTLTAMKRLGSSSTEVLGALPLK